VTQARHDLDQVETHSLICTASYVSPYTGERRQATQRISFRVEHALSVRTKVKFCHIAKYPQKTSQQGH